MIESRLMRLLVWACGMPLASLRYLQRRSEIDAVDGELRSDDAASAGSTPPGTDRARHGVGPLYRRRYSLAIDDSKVSPETLVDIVAADPNVASPTEVAVFVKTVGRTGQMHVGDEFLIRMPGPWNGPVQVIERTGRSFRLATQPGHLEAGTIEFRARADDAGRLVGFEIESWARSANRWQDLLYRRVGISRAIQGSMWAAFLERIQLVSGGLRTGRIRVVTEREAP